MSSQIITPPDLLDNPSSIFIINSIDREVENLILWLKTSPTNFDVYLFHSLMPTDAAKWALRVTEFADTVLVNHEHKNFLTKDLLMAVNRHRKHFDFGSECQYQEPVEYFIKNTHVI